MVLEAKQRKGPADEGRRGWGEKMTLDHAVLRRVVQETRRPSASGKITPPPAIGF